MAKQSLSKQAREHASFLLELAKGLNEIGHDATAADCVKASAIITALLNRLDTINMAHGKIGRVLLGLEDAR